MSVIELLLTAAALSMDAMAVSVSSSLSAKKVSIRNALLMALFFGVFQAAMPFIGYYIIPLLTAVFGSGVENFVTRFDHWIAFILLAFIGGKMIVEAIRNQPEEEHANPFAIGSLLVMAIATSIDALATGIVFRGFEMTGGELLFAFSSIGVVTFLLSFLGAMLGKRVGKAVGEKFQRWTVLAGGVVLVGIGLKILLEHLLG